MRFDIYTLHPDDRSWAQVDSFDDADSTEAREQAVERAKALALEGPVGTKARVYRDSTVLSHAQGEVEGVEWAHSSAGAVSIRIGVSEPIVRYVAHGLTSPVTPHWVAIGEGTEAMGRDPDAARAAWATSVRAR